MPRKPTTPPAGNAPATEAKDTTIPVRVNCIVRIDPAKWVMPEQPQLDPDKLVAALVAAGMPEELAKEQAAALAKPQASGPAAVRTAVREYVFGAIRVLEKLTAAGAEIIDRDREPAKAEAAPAADAAPAAGEGDK